MRSHDCKGAGERFQHLKGSAGVCQQPIEVDSLKIRVETRLTHRCHQSETISTRIHPQETFFNPRGVKLGGNPAPLSDREHRFDCAFTSG